MALRRWQNITNIEYYVEYCGDEMGVISTQDAKKIVAHAAQFVRVLNAYDIYNKKNKKYKYFMFGNYGYKLEEHLDPDTILKVLIKNRATNVIDAGFESLPKIDLMRSFLQTNKVKKLRYDDFAGYHQNIPTGGIEHLTLHFQSINGNLHTFKGAFI